MCARRAVHVRGPTEDEVHVCPAPRRPVPSVAQWRARAREDSTSCALGGGAAMKRGGGRQLLSRGVVQLLRQCFRVQPGAGRLPAVLEPCHEHWGHAASCWGRHQTLRRESGRGPPCRARACRWSARGRSCALDALCTNEGQPRTRFMCASRRGGPCPAAPGGARAGGETAPVAHWEAGLRRSGPAASPGTRLGVRH